MHKSRLGRLKKKKEEVLYTQAEQQVPLHLDWENDKPMLLKTIHLPPLHTELQSVHTRYADLHILTFWQLYLSLPVFQVPTQKLVHWDHLTVHQASYGWSWLWDNSSWGFFICSRVHFTGQRHQIGTSLMCCTWLQRSLSGRATEMVFVFTPFASRNGR